MTDARTIIANAMGHNLAEWRDNPDFLDDGEFESSADAALRELALAGFEVCAVAAPTITPQPLAHIPGASTGANAPGVGGSITPQPTVPVAEVLRFIDAELAYNYNGDAREKALRHLRAKFDGVGGSITPQPADPEYVIEVTCEPGTSREAATALYEKIKSLTEDDPAHGTGRFFIADTGDGVGGSITPVDQEDTDE